MVVTHLAKQVDVPAELYLRYDWSGRTIEYHRAQIRAFLGFREATVQDGHELVAWLAERVMPNEQRADHVREAVFERCRVPRLEPPSTGALIAWVRLAFHTFEERRCSNVLASLASTPSTSC